MKFFKYVYFIACTLFLSACNGDGKNEEEQSSVEISLMQGQWLCVNEGLNTAEFIDFSQLYFAGYTYKNCSFNPEKGNPISGNWGYFKNGDILRMDVNYSETNSSVSKSYKILQLNNFLLQIEDIELTTTKLYHKVVETHSIKSGEVFDIGYRSDMLKDAIYESFNETIAEVDKSGKVKGKKTGTCFIAIKSGSTKVYVIVEVGLRLPTYTSEIMSNIDAIVEEHGNPTKTGKHKEGKFMIAFYINPQFDSGLSEIDYCYDEQTKEIIYIYCTYKNREGYDADIEYLDKNYYHIDMMYAKYSQESRNNYLIYPDTSNNELKVSYMNYVYFRNHPQSQ